MLRCRGRCRGENKLFALYCAKHADKVSVVSCEAKGRKLPALVIPLNQEEFVLVLADFSLSQRIDLSIPSDGGDARKFSITAHPWQFMLASKANGVFRRELCERIRNLDRAGIAKSAGLFVESLVRTGSDADAFLLRGFLMNAPADTGISLGALSAKGRSVSPPALFLDMSLSEADCFVHVGPIARFSLSVPYGSDWLCLVAETRDDALSFLVLNRRQIKLLEKQAEASSASAFEDENYGRWFASRSVTKIEAEKQRRSSCADGPLFSIIVPLYKTPRHFFAAMADSVLHQTYRKWELILVNASPELPELKELIEAYRAQDSRIHVTTLEKNLGITENTNRGIALAKGDYLCFFDHDDVLEPDILFEYAAAISQDPSIDLLYCDEDKLLPNGTLAMPMFKPDFDLDMVRDNNYICHMLTVRHAAYNRIKPSDSELDGAQDHAMVLKIAELGGRIYHVPKVLYHWRISEGSTAGNSDSKPYATEAGIRAVKQHLSRVGLNAEVTCSHGRAFRYRVDYSYPAATKASIIVPTRGEERLLSGLVECLEQTKFASFELILCCSEEDSANVESLLAGKKIGGSPVVIAAITEKFSPSVWLNLGASRSQGDMLVFMHDDARPVENDWLHVLAGFAMRSDVGAAGTMLLDVDGVIQQAGITYVGDRIVELSSGIHSSCPGYVYTPFTVRRVAAVGGACLATSRTAFESLSGFDESYHYDYYDVDYCFRLAAQKKLVVYTPEAPIYHLNVTGASIAGKRKRHPLHYCDKATLLSRWSREFSLGDKYFSPNFSHHTREAAHYKLGSDSESCVSLY